MSACDACPYRAARLAATYTYSVERYWSEAAAEMERTWQGRRLLELAAA